MQLNKVEKLGAGGTSTVLLALIVYFEIGGELKDLLMTVIPLSISTLLALFEFVRLSMNWSSFSEASEERSYKRHHDRIDSDIAHCQRDLKNPHLLEEDKISLQKDLYTLMKHRQRAPSITSTSQSPTGAVNKT
tara:strand:+ start:94 stop:495 length:402 start_codon:yes stop_codon:yes gene_type:complete